MRAFVLYYSDIFGWWMMLPLIISCSISCLLQWAKDCVGEPEGLEESPRVSIWGIARCGMTTLTRKWNPIFNSSHWKSKIDHRQSKDVSGSPPCMGFKLRSFRPSISFFESIFVRLRADVTLHNILRVHVSPLSTVILGLPRPPMRKWYGFLSNVEVGGACVIPRVFGFDISRVAKSLSKDRAINHWRSTVTVENSHSNWHARMVKSR
ncbi:hypothetical protein EDB83DRAFT_1449469 [Lactarius deliciosus]|nr:hypothetical protein EDB83DRAFT_1449469 [Lactarius deliciosus]